jgi:hypothetical protein
MIWSFYKSSVYQQSLVSAKELSKYPAWFKQGLPGLFNKAFIFLEHLTFVKRELDYSLKYKKLPQLVAFCIY